jgi:hypothetical protein
MLAPATNAAGCLALVPVATVQMISPLLGAEIPQMVGPCPASQRDCFQDYNVMAIVVQLDKTLIVDDTKKLLGVWGSTHGAQ